MIVTGLERLDPGHPLTEVCKCFVVDNFDLVTRKPLEARSTNVSRGKNKYGQGLRMDSSNSNEGFKGPYVDKTFIDAGMTVFCEGNAESHNAGTPVVFGTLENLSKRFYVGLSDNSYTYGLGSDYSVGHVTPGIKTGEYTVCFQTNGSGSLAMYFNDMVTSADSKSYSFISDFTGDFHYPDVGSLRASSSSIGMDADLYVTALFSRPLTQSERQSLEDGGWRDMILRETSGSELLLLLSNGAISIQIPAGSLSLTGQAPVVSKAIPVPTGSISITGQAPTLVTSIPVPTGSLTLTGQAPTVGEIVDIEVPTGSISITGRTPVVNTLTPVVVTIPTGSLSLTGQAVTIKVVAGEVVLTASLSCPTLTGSVGFD